MSQTPVGGGQRKLPKAAPKSQQSNTGTKNAQQKDRQGGRKSTSLKDQQVSLVANIEDMNSKLEAALLECNGNVGLPQADPVLDDQLSSRPLNLDEGGYYIVTVDRDARNIVCEHYRNTINDAGLACDPETGEPIACKGAAKRMATTVHRGRTAKEVAVSLFESEEAPPITHLEHAAYLGRELQKAELCLVYNQQYVQD